jgi:hypothetical protein
LPPVSSLFQAENEVRFPVRLAKNPDQYLVVRRSSTHQWPAWLHVVLSFIYPATTNKESADTPFAYTREERAKH